MSRDGSVLASPSPVVGEEDRPPSQVLEDSWGLCLSGGGYRAMLFHLGALWRLNEAGYLPRMTRISSVSGGSITSAMLGLRWSALQFDDSGVGRAFVGQLVDPIRKLASRTIDIGAVARGLILPGSIAKRVSDGYAKHLFGGATLQDLPDHPRFVINASNLQSGALWRFMKPYMRDYKVGEVLNPTIKLAVAVGASSAFPPFLSPVTLKIDEAEYSAGDEPLHRPPYTTSPVLTDGGVYDNLGLETVWKRNKTIFVSDGGGHVQPEKKPRGNWLSQSLRSHNLIDNQVRALRKRQAVDAFVSEDRLGAYWGLWTRVSDYGSGVRLDCPPEASLRLANVSTRLAKLSRSTQEQLINFGYGIADAAVRCYFDPALPDPIGFPYDGGLG